MKSSYALQYKEIITVRLFQYMNKKKRDESLLYISGNGIFQQLNTKLKTFMSYLKC